MGISEEKIYVYPNFINIPIDNENRNESYIVYAGRISEEKGIKELINVFSSMGNLNLKLKIIGEGPLLDEIVHNNQNKEIEIIGVLDNRKVLDIISKSSGVVITTKMFVTEYSRQPIDGSVSNSFKIRQSPNYMSQQYNRNIMSFFKVTLTKIVLVSKS